MKHIALGIFLAALLAAAFGAGYWWGTTESTSVNGIPRNVADKTQHKILYYRHPMGLGDTSPVPKKDAMGMDYVPVYEGEEAQAGKPKGKILYYRNPMGLADTSPVPKKDPMGMDYIPVYEGEQPQGAARSRSASDKVQKLGVKTEPAAMREIARTVLAAGTVQADERRLHAIVAQIRGLDPAAPCQHHRSAGETRPGADGGIQPGPDHRAARLCRRAQRGAGRSRSGIPEAQANMRRLAEGALQRLRNWDIPQDELQRLKQEGKARQTLTLRSPVIGVVLEKPAVQGMRFMPGETLYQIADLSKVWLLAEVFEQDLALVHDGPGGEDPGHRLSGRGVHRQGGVHLSDRHRRDAHRQGAHRAAQSRGCC